MQIKKELKINPVRAAKFNFSKISTLCDKYSYAIMLPYAKCFLNDNDFTREKERQQMNSKADLDEEEEGVVRTNLSEEFKN